MKKILSILIVLSICFVAFSCKEEKKEQKPIDPEKAKFLKKEKKELTVEQKVQVGSVMAKVMATPELKMLSSFIISSELTDTLMKDAGPFTIFAPKNEAFTSLPDDTNKALSNPSNKQMLLDVIKNHIVSGEIDSSMLVQKIKENGGSYKMTSLAGTELTASKSGNDIIIKDIKGAKAVIGKSDILGSNGVVHIVDKPLAIKN